MASQRFLIAPYDTDSGLTTDVKPWRIPDTAFSTLNNAYVFRGRVRKRFGSRWFSNDPLKSRLRMNIGVIGGALTIPAGANTLQIGQMFSVGADRFTITQLGLNVATLTTNPAVTATINTVPNPNTVAFVGAVPGTIVYWYPALPVMGLLSLQTGNINNDFLIGFDQNYAYQYTNGWERLNLGVSTWVGSDSQFFWGATWTGTTAADKFFFVTNFDQNDPNYMRYLDTTLTWNTFRPVINGAVNLDSCRIIVPFHNRLVCLNTWENGLNYTNRARYSWIGDPSDNANAFLTGNGSAIDASTTESIVSSEFIKDRLIVYFERSTWELVYTGNQAYPFTWQQINTELGAESTFSVVPFDRVALGVGNVGVHACNGANVERIDNKIPQEVFDIHDTDEGPKRVYGIRDYFTELVYWTFPDTTTDTDNPYPRKVLVYNYKTATWAFFDDSITVFGYFQPALTGTVETVTWDSTTVTWDDPVPWGSGSSQARFRQVAAGNQEGYTFICDSTVATNAAVLQITNVATVAAMTQLTVINHNVRVGDFLYIQNAVWSDASNGLNDQIFQVTSVTDNQTFTIGPVAPFTGTYAGGGLISRVSKIEITTKQFNFFAEEGRNAYISKIDFMVDTTKSGRITANYFVSTSGATLLQDSAANGTLLGTGILETFPYASIPFESGTTRVWHPVYFQADGEVVQFQLILTDDLMVDTTVRDQNFELHAMCIYADKTSYRFQ